MKRLSLGTLAVLFLCHCSDVGTGDARDAELANVFTRADTVLLRTRTGLVAGKYRRMSSDVYSYYRGNVPMARYDWEMGRTSRSQFGFAAPLVWGLGDPHPENFGILQASDGTFALEANDFDGCDRVPWLWDLRRLTTGWALALRSSNAGDEPAHAKVMAAEAELLRVVARAYAEGIAEYAAGAPRERIDAPGSNPILADLFSRSERDARARAELEELTTLEGSRRRLNRVPETEEDPGEALVTLPSEFEQELLAAMPVPALDAVREFGGGVASWPRLRMIVLYRGATDDPGDDELVTLKEIGESGLQGWGGPQIVADDAFTRVVEGARRAWARPDADALWGGVVWRSIPFLIRSASEGNKGVNIERFEKSRGTPEALDKMGRVLGRLLARIHAASGSVEANAIAARLQGQVDAFAEEEQAAARQAADGVLRDYERFKRLLTERGALLGFSTSAADAPASDTVRELLGGTP